MSSQIPSLLNLEPIIGVSVALNLAFLNIKKFQYIEVIKDILKIRLDNLDSTVKKLVNNTPWYKQIIDMSSVDTSPFSFRSDKNPKFWIGSPSTWGVLYNIIFYWQVGRFFSITGTAYCLLILIFSVGYSVNAVDWFRDYSGSSLISVHFWIATFALIWPIVCILVGTYICNAALNFLRYQTNNIGEQVVEQAEKTLDDTSAAVRAASQR